MCGIAARRIIMVPLIITRRVTTRHITAAVDLNQPLLFEPLLTLARQWKLPTHCRAKVDSG
jgi:hypothetical protein